MERRDFLRLTAVAAGGSVLQPAFAADEPKAKLKKAIKYSMIAGNGTPEEKLALAKKCGFLGVEIDSPSGLDLIEANKAASTTGVKIHGVICSTHWGQPLSSPDEKVRAAGLKGFETAIKATEAVHADTVLLVPGVVTKGVTYDECFERSQTEIKKVLPLAEKLGVKIAIEVVWNNFITKPEQLVEYVDSFKTPTVGAYFDASNMLKYGVPAATWIRKLGKRMLKLDFKGFRYDPNKESKGDWVGIGEGTEDWPEILKACAEVGYNSWATAEVGAGGEAHLMKISKQMDEILELKS